MGGIEGNYRDLRRGVSTPYILQGIFWPVPYIYTTSIITGLQACFCAIKGHTIYSVTGQLTPQYIGVWEIRFLYTGG